MDLDKLNNLRQCLERRLANLIYSSHNSEDSLHESRLQYAIIKIKQQIEIVNRVQLEAEKAVSYEMTEVAILINIRSSIPSIVREEQSIIYGLLQSTGLRNLKVQSVAEFIIWNVDAYNEGELGESLHGNNTVISFQV